MGGTKNTGNAAPSQRIRTITVDGEEVRPRDAYWVITDPQGVPRKAFTSDVGTLDMIPRAARTAFYGENRAIELLNKGWRIQIMSQRRFFAEFAGRLEPLPEDEFPADARLSPNS